MCRSAGVSPGRRRATRLTASSGFPHGMRGSAWFHLERRLSSSFLQGTRPRFASGTLMSLSDDTAFPRWGAVRVRPRFPDAPSGCQPGRSPQRSEERAERPGDGCPCVGAEEICGAPPLMSEGRNEDERRPAISISKAPNKWVISGAHPLTTRPGFPYTVNRVYQSTGFCTRFAGITFRKNELYLPYTR